MYRLYSLVFRYLKACYLCCMYSCHCCALCQEHRELKLHPLSVWPLPAIPEQIAGRPMPVPQSAPMPFHYPQEAPLYLAPPIMRPQPYYPGHRVPQPVYPMQQITVRAPLPQRGGPYPGHRQQMPCTTSL